MVSSHKERLHAASKVSSDLVARSIQLLKYQKLKTSLPKKFMLDTQVKEVANEGNFIRGKSCYSQ